MTPGIGQSVPGVCWWEDGAAGAGSAGAGDVAGVPEEMIIN